MDFDDDFEDSFGQFLSDNNNILFRKQQKSKEKDESVNKSIKDDSITTITSRKSAKIIDDVILLSSDEDDIIEQHKTITPEKKNKVEVIELGNSNSSSDVEPIFQSISATSRNTPDCLQDLTDITFSDFSYLKDSPFFSVTGKTTTTTTATAVISQNENSQKDFQTITTNQTATTSSTLSSLAISNHPTPLKKVNAKSLTKSKLFPGSTKKKHRLPGRKTVPKPIDNPSNENEFVAPKPTALQQKDAIRHIVVHISNKILELIEKELSQLDTEKRLNYTSFEQNSDDILFCPYLYWKPMIKLKELLEKNEHTTNYNSPTFNQIMVFVTPELLHRNVHAYVKKELSGEALTDDSFVDLLDIIKKCSTDMNKCSQITVVIHGLDDYLKIQQNKANRKFRRQMNQIMSTNDDQQQRKKTTKTNKNNDNDNDETDDNLIELTLENIDMYLIDLGMRFLLEFGGIGSANFTPMIVESATEIVDLIYRYSRSLSEQLFRNDRRGDAGSEVYMIKGRIAAMELDEAKGRQDVEKIWLKQLQQMPSIKASVSKAIVEHFPTPFSLWNRLQNSSNPIGLLTKIGHGTNSKVSVDLAEKIHLFMVSDMPNDVLKTATSARS